MDWLLRLYNMNYFIVCGLFGLAGILNAVMDVVKQNWYESIFNHKIKNASVWLWFRSSDSHKPRDWRRFLSITWDAWHCSKDVMLGIFMFLPFAVQRGWLQVDVFALWGMASAWWLTHEMFLHWILRNDITFKDWIRGPVTFITRGR